MFNTLSLNYRCVEKALVHQLLWKLNTWALPWLTGYCHGLLFKGARVGVQVGASGFRTTFPLIMRFNCHTRLREYVLKNKEPGRRFQLPGSLVIFISFLTIS